MAIGYRVPAHAVTAPATTTPVTETGRLGVEVYTAAGALAGWVPDIVRAQITRRVNQVGSFEFATSPPAKYKPYLDNVVSADTGAASSLTITGFAVGAGARRVLIVGVSMSDDAGTGSVSGITYAGIALTQVGQQVGAVFGFRVELWALFDPPVGSGSVVVTMSEQVATLGVGVASYGGVGSIGTPVGANGATATPTVNVSSAAGELVVGVVITTNVTTPIASGPGQIGRWADEAIGSGHTIEYAGSDEPGAGTVTISWSLSGSADWSILAAALRPPTPILQAGQQVRIFREGEGEIFRGIIDDLGYEGSDGPLLVVSGSSMAEELVWLNTYLGIPVEDQPIQDAVASLMTEATSWQAAVGGAGFAASEVTDPFINQSVFRALTRVADVVDGYVRETKRPREIQVTAETNPSGIRLCNIEYADPGLLDNDLLGIIQSLKVRQEGSAIINRIVPYGADAQGLILDLASSGRSSPYMIQNFVPRRPRVTNSKQVTFSLSAAVGRTESSTEFDVVGQNRLILVAFSSKATDIDFNNAIGCRANGKSWTRLQTLDQTSTVLAFGYIQAPDSGRVVMEFNANNQTAVSKTVVVTLVALADCLQTGSPVDASGIANGTSTAPSVAVSTGANSLVVDFLAHIDATATVGAGQTVIIQSDAEDARSSKEIGSGDSVTMSWTLGSSVNWKIGAASIKPQPVYYIEDSTSVTAYGRRAVPLILKADRHVAGTDLTDAANTLYDIASTRLQKLKDPVDFYDVQVARMPTDWLVGDSMHLQYRGLAKALNAASTEIPTVWLDVDEHIPVLERTESFDESGVRTWRLKLATVYRFPRTTEETFSGQLAAVADLEAM